MRTKMLKLLFKKEILDVFRDKKAIIMMIFVPIMLYPLIFFGCFAVMTMIQNNMESENYKAVIIASDNGALENSINLHNAEAEKKAAAENVKASSTSASKPRDEINVVKSDVKNYKKALQNEQIDVYVTSGISSEGKIEYNIYYVSSITNSNYAAGIVKDIIDKMEEKKADESIQEAGLSVDAVMNPIIVNDKDIASSEQSAGSMLGTILPFLLVFSLLIGTMYPAIDTTAGEKERGTLETLLTLPVSNREIIIAKFLTVALIGIISAILNVVSMGFMAFYMFHIMKDEFVGMMGISFGGFNIAKFVPAIIFTILAILAFSLFISAVTMCITAFAKSYKEANNYITPLTLVVMFTGYIGFIPNVELTHKMALVPIANICLMIKNLLLFKVDYGIIAIVLISNVVYAFLAVMFLGKIYDSESVLFDEGRFSLQLFQKRRNIKKGGTPTPGDAWFITFLVMFVYIFLGTLLQIKYGIGGVFGIQMIILVIPLIYVFYTKKSLKETYSFKKTHALSFVAALFLGIGTILIGGIITQFVAMIFPNEAENVGTELESVLMTDSPVITLLVTAVAPAICEEMMFRGFLLSSFRSKYKIVTSIILVSVIFGVYHMSIVRFFTTAVLGAALAAVVYFSDSIYPAMMMHFMNNSLAVAEMYYPDAVSTAFPLLATDELSIMSSIVVGAMGILLAAAGISIFIILKQRKIVNE